MLATAIASAVAAVAAAISSWLIWRTTKRNLLESVRPELALLDWGRTPREDAAVPHEAIRIGSLRNVGRGAAFQVTLSGFEMWDGQVTAHIATARIGVMGAGEEVALKSLVDVFWDKVAVPERGPKTLAVWPCVACLDAMGVRHVTTYLMFVSRDTSGPQPVDSVAAGITFAGRHTVTKSVRRLKLEKRLRRIPGLRRLVPADKPVRSWTE